MEIWKPVPGYAGGYTVSSYGRVWSNKTRKFMKFQPQKSGHLGVNLCLQGVKTRFTVHGLVAVAFLGERPAHLQVRHLNGVCVDNRLSNLAYGTGSENRIDAYAHGGRKSGQECHLSKKSNADISRLRSLRGELSSKEASALFGLSDSYVREIWRGEARRYDRA